MRVIIVGGGLVGCRLAYQLAKRGQPVLLLEAQPGLGPPGRNGGMIMKIDGRDSKASRSPSGGRTSRRMTGCWTPSR
jgi:glycine/D-amino acid oxidase-like deaminating enzyme